MTNQLPRVHEMEHHAADWATTRPVVAGTTFSASVPFEDVADAWG